MANPLPDQATHSGQGALTRYAYKASLIGGAHQFELTDKGLSWQIGGKSGVWPYAEISTIRLSYRPVSMQAHRFRADIERADGQRIVIFSTSRQTIALMSPQDQDYRSFITQLHERMAQVSGRAALIAGIGPKTYAAGIALLALVGISIAGLLVRALGTGEWAGALFLVGFAVLFGWQIGGFIRRNRPRNYTFDTLPPELLP